MNYQSMLLVLAGRIFEHFFRGSEGKDGIVGGAFIDGEGVNGGGGKAINLLNNL